MASKLTVITGSMFAGKSTELLRQGERHHRAGLNVVYVKPKMDKRYSEEAIVTHTGERVNAILYDTETGIIPHYIWKALYEADVFLIDEIQFFNRTFLTEIISMLERGKKVYVAGLDMDYSAQPFEMTANLMAMADEVIKLKAVCNNCGADSYVSARLTATTEVVELGSEDKYMPLCRECYVQHKKQEVTV